MKVNIYRLKFQNYIISAETIRDIIIDSIYFKFIYYDIRH